MPNEKSEQMSQPTEDWATEASKREFDLSLKLDKLTTSDAELVGAAYERAGDLKKAAEFYLMYGGGDSAFKIFKEHAFSQDDINEVKRNAADRLDSFANGIMTAPKPTPPLVYSLPDYDELARVYRRFAEELRSQITGDQS